MLVVFLSPSSRGLLTWLVKCIHSIDFPFSFSILGEKIGFSYLSFLSKIPRDVVLPKPKAPAKLIYYKSSRCSFFQKKPIPYIEERMLNFKYIRRNRACWIQKYLCFHQDTLSNDLKKRGVNGNRDLLYQLICSSAILLMIAFVLSSKHRYRLTS